MKIVTIGRSSQNDIVINDTFASRHHLQIVQHNDGCFSLVDFGSTNGTYVNGRRVYGEVWLNPDDEVRIGSTKLPWNTYFRSRKISPSITSTLPIILGVVGVVAVLVIVLLLGFQNETSNEDIKPNPKHQFSINGISFDFGMTIDELKTENDNASVVKYSSPSNEDDEYASVTYYSTDYWIINNTIAAMVSNNTRINFFSTQSSDYKTPKGVHVGSTWGEVEKAYPYLEWSLTCYCYNYFSFEHEIAIEAYDPSTCTYFYFYQNQFSATQWESVLAASGATDFVSSFDVSAVSVFVMQSIRSSVIVSEISVSDCNQAKSSNALNDYKSYGCLKYRLIKDNELENERLELHNTCDEDIRVTGYLLNAIARHGGENTLDFEMIVRAKEREYIEGFMENECNIKSVKKLNSASHSNTPNNTSPKSPNSSSGEPANKNFSYDYYVVISYNSTMFDNASEGYITLPNGDQLRYKYEKDMDFFPMWSLLFSMDGVDIRKKYKVAALKTLDAEEGYAGKDDDYNARIKVLISCGGFIKIQGDKLYIIVKKK